MMFTSSILNISCFWLTLHIISERSYIDIISALWTWHDCPLFVMGSKEYLLMLLELIIYSLSLYLKSPINRNNDSCFRFIVTLIHQNKTLLQLTLTRSNTEDFVMKNRNVFTCKIIVVSPENTRSGLAVWMLDIFGMPRDVSIHSMNSINCFLLDVRQIALLGTWKKTFGLILSILMWEKILFT